MRASPNPRDKGSSILSLGNPPECSRAKSLRKDFTFSTDLHLMAPAILRFSEANGPVDKPAKIARIEFPGRTTLTSLYGAALDIPARPGIVRLSFLHIQQEKHLTLDMYGNLPPSLFKTLNGLKRSSQKLCHFFLRLLELLAK